MRRSVARLPRCSTRAGVPASVAGQPPAGLKSIPESDREVAGSITAPESKIEGFVEGKGRISSQLQKEVIADEARKPMPAEPMEQRFHAEERETPDRYQEVMRSDVLVEKQESLKARAEGTSKYEEVGGRSFQAGIGAGETEEYADITLIVESVKIAQKDIEKIVEYLEGQIIETEDFKDRHVLIISYDPSKTKELLEKLRLIGKIEGEGLLVEEREGLRKLSIEIIEQ